MASKLTETHDRLGLAVAIDGHKVRFGTSRSRDSLFASTPVPQADLQAIFKWFVAHLKIKDGQNYGVRFRELEAFANSCKNWAEFVAGPKASSPKEAGRRAPELTAKPKPATEAATSGKYDHLYKPGMTAKEKQAVRAKARRS